MERLCLLLLLLQPAHSLSSPAVASPSPRPVALPRWEPPLAGNPPGPRPPPEPPPPPADSPLAQETLLAHRPTTARDASRTEERAFLFCPANAVNDVSPLHAHRPPSSCASSLDAADHTCVYPRCSPPRGTSFRGPNLKRRHPASVETTPRSAGSWRPSPPLEVSYLPRLDARHSHSNPPPTPPFVFTASAPRASPRQAAHLMLPGPDRDGGRAVRPVHSVARPIYPAYLVEHPRCWPPNGGSQAAPAVFHITSTAIPCSVPTIWLLRPHLLCVVPALFSPERYLPRSQVKAQSTVWLVPGGNNLVRPSPEARPPRLAPP
jgi:hypothetical protein